MSTNDKAKQREYQKRYYEKNKKYYQGKAAERKKAIKAWFQEYKATHPCTHCGESAWQCLDFHHVDPSQKETTLYKALQQCWSIERIMNEMAKCVVLCATCHRKVHAGLIQVA